MSLSTAPATHPDTTAASPVRRRDLTLGLSGVAFATLLVPVIAIPHASLDYPNDKPPAGSVITHFFAAHHATQQLQTVGHSLAGLALLVFFAALARRVAAVEGPRSTASRLTLVGGAGVATIMVVTMVVAWGTVSLTGGVDGQVQGWLYNLAWSGHFRSEYLLPVALAPGCLVLRGRGLPAALAWTGVVLGGLALVAMVAGVSTSTEFLMFPVFFLLILWVLVTGVVALTRGLSDVAQVGVGAQ